MTVTENVPPAAPPRHGGLRITSALLLGASLVILSVRTVEPLGDPDTLWHLLLGRHLIGSWDFGPIDPLSTLSTQPWVYNQWLPEIVAAWFESWGGLPAVAWLWVAGRVALVLATWALCRSTTSPLPAAIATLAAFAGAFAGTSARPQLVGLVMFVGAVWAVLLTAKDGRARWWLVPYTWLWACVHGLWVFGVVLGLLVAAAALVDRRGDAWQRHLLRFAVPLASTVAAALTPVGPRLVLAFVQVSGINEFIQEWQPGSTVLPTFTIVLVTVGVLLVIWFRTGHRPTWTELALVVFAVACCLYTRRTVAVAALTAELVRTLQDIQVGQPRRTAFEALSERVAVPELRRFLRAVVQAEEYGIALADVLHTQAGEMRIMRRQRAERKAMEIPVKVTFPLILFILPVLFIVILGPAAINVLDTLT